MEGLDLEKGETSRLGVVGVKESGPSEDVEGPTRRTEVHREVREDMRRRTP